MALTNAQARCCVLVISGPSGVGKSATERALAEKYGLNFMVSHTSRSMREGEVNALTRQDGRGAYYFVSKEEFDSMLEDGDLVEHAYIYDGAGYGLSHTEAWHATEGGNKIAVLVVNTEGCRQILDVWPDVWTVWMDPPHNEVLRERMKKRNDSPEQIEKRMSSVKKEQRDGMHVGYQFRVVNDDFDTCLAEIKTIIDAMALRR